MESWIFILLLLGFIFGIPALIERSKDNTQRYKQLSSGFSIVCLGFALGTVAYVLFS